jgi:hypothetical protein
MKTQEPIAFLDKKNKRGPPEGGRKSARGEPRNNVICLRLSDQEVSDIAAFAHGNSSMKDGFVTAPEAIRRLIREGLLSCRARAAYRK